MENCVSRVNHSADLQAIRSFAAYHYGGELKSMMGLANKSRRLTPIQEK
jgi:hypothetical protein